MSNTSTIHIKTDFDCKVYDYGQEIGSTKADTFCSFELRKGEHELTFVFVEDESVSKTVNYIVENADCDYRLIIEIVESICDKAEKQYDSENYSFAFRLYLLAAEKGFAKAQYGLGFCYNNGFGIKADHTKAFEWFSKAFEWYTNTAKHGDTEALYMLGNFYYFKTHVEQNGTKAFEFYTKAAEQGNADASYMVGNFYENGFVIAQDHIKAREWYTKSAELGNVNAQLRLGEIFEFSVGDITKAIEWYTKATKQGCIDAQYRINSILEEKKLSETIKNHIEAAEQGNAFAQWLLGELYLNGKGDFINAMKWYTKSADQGYAAAQFSLGCLYYEGSYVKEDLLKAVELFTKAAEQGNRDAQFELGRCYKNGFGVEIDYVKAIEWYTKAAEQGHPMAYFNLGICYENGDGIEQDLHKAAEWYSKAAELGVENAPYTLALCYQELEDTENAIKWFTKAAEKGEKLAYYNLGDYYKYYGDKYELGKECPKDHVQAMKWYFKSLDCYEKSNNCGSGFNNNDRKEGACYFIIGSFYENEGNTEKDYTKAIEYYNKAAMCHNSDAQLRLGKLCIAKKDYIKAVEWFTKAANRCIEARYYLGVCYEQGFGIEKDLTKAMECYNIAAKLGSAEAKKRLDEISNQDKAGPAYYLFFDTETTGLFVDEKQSFGLHSSFFKNNMRVQLMRQPHMVQLSWITTDKDCNIISQHDYIIQPKGFSIPPEATRIHGITTEIAKEKGTPIKEVIERFMEDVYAANTLVGHNIAFDRRVINTELIRLRLNNEYDDTNSYDFDSKESICTMKKSIQYCEIPSHNYYHPYKQPKLQELHKKLFGYEFEDAHNSMSDVKATLKCFKEIKKLGWI